MPIQPVQPTPPQYPPSMPFPPDGGEGGGMDNGIIPGETPPAPHDPRFPGSQPDLS